MEENSIALIPDLLAGTEEAIQYVSEALNKAIILNIWPITTTLGVHSGELTIV